METGDTGRAAYYGLQSCERWVEGGQVSVDAGLAKGILF
jgi:hypothetical protein